MRRQAVFVLLVAASARADALDDLREAKNEWKKLDQQAKLARLEGLKLEPSAALLAQCERWARDKDIVVRAKVLHVVAAHALDAKLRNQARGILARQLKEHMDARARKEKAEFKAVCKQYGGKLGDFGKEMKAGADWQDPYDEERRKLPDDIRAEREFMKQAIAAIELTELKSLNRTLLRIFLEHHDPVVIVRTVQCWGRWKEWHALPAMADLARIQSFGHTMGGGDVIGKEKYETLRLKWDHHKDRLWWSRPEYVTRVSHPIYRAATATTGAEIDSAAGLDLWLLDHEQQLRQHGVKLSAAFRVRARSSRR